MLTVIAISQGKSPTERSVRGDISIVSPDCRKDNYPMVYYFARLIISAISTLALCGCPVLPKSCSYTSGQAFRGDDKVYVRTIKGDSVSSWEEMFLGIMVEQKMILFTHDPNDESLNNGDKYTLSDGKWIGRYLFQNRSSTPIFIAGICDVNNVVTVRAYSIQIYDSNKWLTIHECKDKTIFRDFRIDPAQEVIMCIDISPFKSIKRPIVARVEHCGWYSQPFIVEK